MKKLKENQKKFLGTVPKKYQLVETFWDCPEISKTNNKGITLIALIITIIVMLILVGVTINVALNGGLFGKAKKATYQTEASMVKEQLEFAKTVAIAENNGKVLSDYSVITIDNTDLDSKIKDKYREKIIVKSNGNICYDPTYVTDEEERSWLKEIGISEYIISENPWQERGLTVPVKYDTNYYGTGGELDNIALNISSMTLKLEGTGGFIVEELDWNYSNDEVNDMISEGTFVVASDSISLYGDIEWRFNLDGTQVTVYDISGSSEKEIVTLDVQ